jgi:MFS family permease
MTVFALSWGVTALHYTRQHFLLLQMIGVLFFGLTIPLSAVWADRVGRRRVLIAATLAIILFGFAFAPLLETGSTFGVLAFLCIGLALMGWTYGPLGTALSELFPTSIRYTGASLTFNLAGIFGASLAPYIATSLGNQFGIASVGWYLSGCATLTLLALLFMPRASH